MNAIFTNLSHLRINKIKFEKSPAPGEARTHSLRISSNLGTPREGTVYKYGALTDCATGAVHVHKSLILNQMMK